MGRCGLLLLLVACAHNVPQDRATGPDGKVKGAKAIAFENGEAKTKGIVTYPGGDRVDWRLLELPEGRRGQLEIELRYKTPRPGLQVAFDVFDQWNTPVVAAAGGRRAGRIRTASIADARGKYFVRVYAPKRGDAGQYLLVATFKEIEQPPPMPEAEIPDPPRLPAIPEVEPTCETFDPKNTACAKECPFDAPPGWKGCKDRDDKAAADEARKAAEAERKEREKNAPKPFVAQIKHVQVNGSAIEVRVMAGNAATPALDKTWRAELIGADGKPIIGARVTILGVESKSLRAEIRGLTQDQINANPRIRLTPPPLSP